MNTFNVKIDKIFNLTRTEIEAFSRKKHFFTQLITENRFLHDQKGLIVNLYKAKL